MSEEFSSAVKRRCKGRNRLGRRCEARVIGASGFCAVHDPESPVDMRALGRKGGTVGRGNARLRRQLASEPESLRAVLRELDPRAIKQTIEEILAGTNAAAKMSAIKLLSDLETYQREERERALDYAGARERLALLIAKRAERHQRDEQDELERLREQVTELEARLAEYQVTA